MKQAEQLSGIRRQAYKLVINHSPPSMHIDRELELTRLTTTALLMGIDESWLATHLENDCLDVITKRVKRSLH